jgi:hypothetical protein
VAAAAWPRFFGKKWRPKRSEAVGDCASLRFGLLRHPASFGIQQ